MRRLGKHARGRQRQHHRQRHRHARRRHARHRQAARRNQVRQHQPQKRREGAQVAPVVGFVQHDDDPKRRHQHQKAPKQPRLKAPSETQAAFPALHRRERARQAQPRRAQVEPVKGVLHGRAHGIAEVVDQIGLGMAEEHLHEGARVGRAQKMVEEALRIGRGDGGGEQVASHRHGGGQQRGHGHAKARLHPRVAQDHRDKQKEIRDAVQASHRDRQACQQQHPRAAAPPVRAQKRQIEQHQGVVEHLRHGRGAVEHRGRIEHQAQRKQRRARGPGADERAVRRRAQRHPHRVTDDDGMIAQPEELDKPAVEHHRRKAVRAQRAHAGELLQQAVVAGAQAHGVPGEKIAPVVQLVRPDGIGGKGVAPCGQRDRGQQQKRRGDQQPPPQQRGRAATRRQGAQEIDHPSHPPLCRDYVQYTMREPMPQGGLREKRAAGR